MILKSNEQVSTFKPVELTIVIETPEDYATLWAMANISDKTMMDFRAYDFENLPFPSGKIKQEVWKKIDSLAVATGLRK